MASDSWTRLSSASKRHHSAFHAPDAALRGWRDLFSEFEEVDSGEEESCAELSCPFCFEDFDVVGLCCHVDEEHPVEAKSGVCPICTASIGLDLVGHLTIQHANFNKMQRRRKQRKGGSSSATQTVLSQLRKDFREGNIQTLLGGSSFAAPTAAAPDPFLSSLLYTLPGGESPKDAQLESLDEASLANKGSEEKVAKRAESTLSDKDQKELALRSEFARGLVLSTIFDDRL